MAATAEVASTRRKGSIATADVVGPARIIPQPTRSPVLAPTTPYAAQVCLSLDCYTHCFGAAYRASSTI